MHNAARAIHALRSPDGLTTRPLLAAGDVAGLHPKPEKNICLVETLIFDETS